MKLEFHDRFSTNNQITKFRTDGRMDRQNSSTVGKAHCPVHKENLGCRIQNMKYKKWPHKNCTDMRIIIIIITVLVPVYVLDY